MGTKKTKSIGFINQDKNKGMFNSKSTTWNKKKQKHNMCKTKIQQDFILKTKQEQNKVVIRNVPKTNIEHIKGN
jgi:hypothetical protein